MNEETMTPETAEEKKGLNFVEQIVSDDLAAGKNGGRLNTRFPPEPNGYLHIGHAKAICMDFGVAEKFGGTCNLRFDDTNPVKEDVEYVDSIREDIHWLGFDWGDREYYASDYFPQLYAFAERLIREGKAYVDDQTSEEIATQKGTPTQPGVESPYRNRTPEENLDLFHRMNAGEFPDGARVLRAKIDMANPNMHFRDPIIYRIIHHPHHRTGDKWKVYPMYDFAHGQSDYFEGVTHSICTLEFEVHRPLYEYFVKELAEDAEKYCPRQIEFNRLNLTYTVMSKRKLLQLVKEGLVSGWDDPRMPTVSGMRRRGFTPQSIRNFIDRIGYTKYEALNSMSLLEHAVREDLNAISTRVMAVMNPLKVVLTNYPEGKTEMVSMETIPKTPMPAHMRCLSHVKSTSSVTTSWKIHPRSSSVSLPVRKCVSKAHTSSSARRSSRIPTAISPNCAAPSIPRAEAACPELPAKSRVHSTGYLPRMPWMPQRVSTTAFSWWRTWQKPKAISTTT